MPLFSRLVCVGYLNKDVLFLLKKFANSHARSLSKTKGFILLNPSNVTFTLLTTLILSVHNEENDKWKKRRKKIIGV